MPGSCCSSPPSTRRDFKVDSFGWALLRGAADIGGEPRAAGDPRRRRRGRLLAAGDRARGPARRASRPAPTCPGSSSWRSTGWRLPVLRRAMRDGNAPVLARWLAGGHAPTARVGDRPLVADRRQPGRDPARLQRGHSRVSLGREGDGQGDELLGAGRLRRDRAPPSDRARTAGRRRRQPREPALRGSRRGDPHRQPDGRREAQPTPATGRFWPTASTSPASWSCSSGRRCSSTRRRSPSDGATSSPAAQRGGRYPFLRAALCVVVRDLIVFGVLTDMMRGRPAVYATFSSYDEVAHHSGLERADTLEALRKLDQQFGRIDRARRFAPAPVQARRALRPRADAGHDVQAAQRLRTG